MSRNPNPSAEKKKRPFILSIIKLIRPYQWTKNAFIFAALIFNGSLSDTALLLRTLAGFAVFCMISGCVYILNDIVDRDKDRAHHKKCTRPIASGDVAVWQALIIFILLLAGALFWGFRLSISFGIVIIAYFIINIAYSFGLKNRPIIDLMCIAAGFVLRVVSGGFIIDCYISPWLLLCTLLLALYLAIQKRRAELSAVEKGLTEGRAVLQHYSSSLLREMSSVMDSATIMAYCLYTFMSDASQYMMLTIPFVIYGIFRYQYIAEELELAEAPDKALLKDIPLIIDILLWCITCVIILYVIPHHSVAL